MIRRTFDSKGHDYASELTLANCRDLDSIMDWNVGQGYDLLPELGYKPTNKYLPPRPRRDHLSSEQEQVSILDMANSDGSYESNETNNPLLKWVDAVLSR